MTDEQKIISKLEAMKQINIQKDEVEKQIERVLELKGSPGLITHIDIQGYKFQVPDAGRDSLLQMLGDFEREFRLHRARLIGNAEKIIKEN